MGDLREDVQALVPRWGQRRAYLWYLGHMGLVIAHLTLLTVGSSLLSGIRDDMRQARLSVARERSAGSWLSLVVMPSIAVSVIVAGTAGPSLLAGSPYPRPHELMAITPVLDGVAVKSSLPEYYDYVDALDLGLGADLVPWGLRGALIEIPGLEPTHDAVVVTDHRFGAMLGNPLAQGRWFTAREDRHADQVIVISDAWWKRFFGGKDDVLGRSLTLGGLEFRVIGRMAPGAELPSDAGAWMPASFERWRPAGFDPERSPTRGTRFLDVMLRVESPAELLAMGEQLDSLAERLNADYPSDYGERMQLTTVSLSDQQLGVEGPVLRVVLASLAIFLMLTALSLSVEQRAVAARRRAEMALRSHLGASRARLALQLLLETILLIGPALIVGATLGAGGLFLYEQSGAPAWLHALTPPGIAALCLALVLGFIMTASLARATVLCRLHPDTAKRRSLSRAGAQRWRSGLVAAQVAGLTVLVVTAALLVGSLLQLRAIDPGFTPGELLTGHVVHVGPEALDAEYQGRIWRHFAKQLEAHPAIRRAALASAMPLQGAEAFTRVRRVDVLPVHASKGGGLAPDTLDAAYVQLMTDQFLELIEAPLVAGRVHELEDDEVVVNEELISRLPSWHGIGSRIYIEGGQESGAAIAGIVAGERYQGLSKPPEARVYVPLDQAPAITGFVPQQFAVVIELRAEAVFGASDFAALVDEALPPASVGDHLAPVTRVKEEHLDGPRTVSAVFAAFSALAAVLGCLGLRRLFLVELSLRRTEIGVRLALGASAVSLRRAMYRELALTVSCAAGVGLQAGLILWGTLDTYVGLPMPGFGIGVLTACLVPIAGAWLTLVPALRLQLRSEIAQLLRVQL